MAHIVPKFGTIGKMDCFDICFSLNCEYGSMLDKQWYFQSIENSGAYKKRLSILKCPAQKNLFECTPANPKFKKGKRRNKLLQQIRKKETNYWDTCVKICLTNDK